MAYLSSHLLNGHFSQTLFWTFVHSLWQAALLSFFAALMLLFTKQSKPRIRYNLLSSLFLLSVISSGITFLYLWNKSAHIDNAATEQIMKIPFQVRTEGILLAFLNKHSHLLLIVWFFIFLIKITRMGIALRETYQVRNKEIQIPGHYWTERFQALSERLKINGKVQLFESATLKIPATLGFLKPVVLVPLGLLGKLPPEQVEAILLHELAHIKRKDFLANSIQKSIEAVFFFNPFLLWISKLITEERENCCDEIALAQTKDKTILVKALINFEEYRHFSLKLALNFGRQKGQLLNRVKRIALNQNKTLNDVEKIFITISLFLFVGLSFSISRSGQKINPYSIMNNKVAVTRERKEQVIFQGIVIEFVNLSSNQDTLKVAKAITKDLIENGIIKNTKALSYKLDNEELIVNGIKQPVALHQKLKEKYVREQGWRVLYNKNHQPENKFSDMS